MGTEKNEPVRFGKQRAVGIINKMNNPPVNALSQPVRQGLHRRP